MRENLTAEELANVREHLRIERAESLSNWRSNWRTLVCMTLYDFANNAFFGFIGGMFVFGFFMEPLAAEFVKLCRP